MKIPEISNPDLAYETGLHIGDGSLFIDNKSTYRFAYYGNNITERKFLNKIVIPLFLKLYGFEPHIESFGNTCFFRIGSKELLNFKAKVLNLPVGNKEQLKSLPKIFLSDKNLLCNLLAGIFDSDGSVSKNRNKYPRFSLALKNESLIKEIKQHLLHLGITSTIHKNEYYDKRVNKNEITWHLDINGIKNFNIFMDKIKIKNPNHLRRIKNFNFKDY